MKIKISNTQPVVAQKTKTNKSITRFVYSREGDDKTLYKANTFDNVSAVLEEAQKSGDYVEVTEVKHSDEYNNDTIKFKSGAKLISSGPKTEQPTTVVRDAEQPQVAKSSGGYTQVSFDEFQLVSGRALSKAIENIKKAYDENPEAPMPPAASVLEAAQAMQTTCMIHYCKGEVARLNEAALLDLAQTNEEFFSKNKNQLENLINNKGTIDDIGKFLDTLKNSKLLPEQKKVLVETAEKYLQKANS